MILHLGVVDMPYAYEQQQLGKNGQVLKRKKKKLLSTTTGDVAEFLEAKYHVMEIFFEENQQEIASALEEGMAGAIESLVMGAPATLDPFGAGTSAIETRFKNFLLTGQIEKVGYPGIPTQAALMGVNHRMARPHQRRARRPSFIDTGLYESSFKAWVD